MAWYVTDGDLVRAGGHKYIDKIRNAAGNWTYIYEDAKNKLTSGVNSIKSRINNYKTNKNANKVSNDEATKRIKENAAANRAESDKQLSTARMQASKQKAASLAAAEKWKKEESTARMQVSKHRARVASQSEADTNAPKKLTPVSNKRHTTRKMDNRLTPAGNNSYYSYSEKNPDYKEPSGISLVNLESEYRSVYKKGDRERDMKTKNNPITKRRKTRINRAKERSEKYKR